MHIDILFGILLTLVRHKQVTAKYLANKYDVSIRTIYRYLTVLDSNNIPIQTKRGKNGGVILNNCIGLNNLFFTASEKVALLNLTHQIDSVSIRTSLQTKLISLDM
jgi:predicted DNA-binding transcriptional regulator YafY